MKINKLSFFLSFFLKLGKVGSWDVIVMEDAKHMLKRLTWSKLLSYELHRKKTFRYSRPQPRCDLPNSPYRRE